VRALGQLLFAVAVCAALLAVCLAVGRVGCTLLINGFGLLLGDSSDDMRYFAARDAGIQRRLARLETLHDAFKEPTDRSRMFRRHEELMSEVSKLLLTLEVLEGELRNQEKNPAGLPPKVVCFRERFRGYARRLVEIRQEAKEICTARPTGPAP
jgi:hypothetical protein